MNYYLGLDVGGTNLAAGVVTEDLKLVAKAVIPSGADGTVEEIVERMGCVSRMALEKAGISQVNVPYWGIGMPSHIHPRTGLLVHANCFKWKNLPILDYLARQMSIPILIENDANCAAYGEMLAGAGSAYTNAVMLTLGTGVGGGIILDGKLYTGADQMGAELGHVKLVYGGRACTCGQRGCLEAYCSATALADMTREALQSGQFGDSALWSACGGDLSALTVKQIFDAWKTEDRLAGQMVAQYCGYLAAGISTFVTIFRPEVIILGGGVANAGAPFFQRVNERLSEQTFAAAEMGVPKVIPAALGNDAGIIGAAMLGRRNGNIKGA